MENKEGWIRQKGKWSQGGGPGKNSVGRDDEKVRGTKKTQKKRGGVFGKTEKRSSLKKTNRSPPDRLYQ